MNTYQGFAQPAEQWFTFAVWTRLTGNYATGAFNYYGTGSSTGAMTNSFPISWTLDMIPKLNVCADANGANSVGCRVANLKAWYHDTPASSLDMKSGTSRKSLSELTFNK